jgi:regulator of sigma E protease
MMDGTTVQAIFSNVYAVAAVVLLFGISVFVHEFGHFLAARLCGLVVDVFSIGFGPALWKRKMGSLELKVGCIPFGGYVALPQLDPTGMETVQGADGEPARTLPAVAVWKKIVVSLAGAAGNIIFAFILAWTVYLAGRPSMPGSQGPLVGLVETNTVAYAGGLRAGDTIQSVNGQAVKSWTDFVQICSFSEKVDLRVKRADGGEAEMSLATSTNANAFQIRMLEGVEQGSVCKVGRVLAGSMAEKAGVQMGDIIKSFNGVVVAGRGHMISMVQERAGLDTALVVERKGVQQDLTVTPKLDPDRKVVLIGIEFDAMSSTPWEQIKQDASSVFRILKALVTPAQAGNAAKSIGGPVAIFGMFWIYAKASFLLVLGFARYINVNLAILNLLPIPVLDGGHIVFSLWQGITRRPLNEKVIRFLVNGFAIILITLIVFLSFRDLKVWRIFKGLMDKESAVAEAPAVPGVATNQAEAATNQTGVAP